MLQLVSGRRGSELQLTGSVRLRYAPPNPAKPGSHTAGTLEIEDNYESLARRVVLEGATRHKKGEQRESLQPMQANHLSGLGGPPDSRGRGRFVFLVLLVCAVQANGAS